MRDTETLVAEVLELPEAERVDLVARILATLDGTPDLDVEDAWALELARRGAATDSGEAVTSDWEVLRRRIERDIFGRK